MRRVSRLISDRRKLARRLEARIGAYAEPFGELLLELLAPELEEGETLPDAGLEIELLLRVLGRRLAELEAQESLYRRELLKLNRLRAERDRAARETNREIQAVRRKVDAALGRGGAAEVLQLTGRTGRRAQAIHAQARWVVGVLQGLGEEPAVGVTAAQAAEWLEMVEPAFLRLDQWLGKTDELTPMVDKIRFNRDLAAAEFDHVARHLVGVVKSLALLLKQKKQAERIRRAGKKRKRPGPEPRKRPGPRKKKGPTEPTAPEAATETPREPDEPE